jgi:phytoene dehydrogenase-like protein
MSFDAIIIGAGIGGLGCAARLARHGLRVLVLEKNSHIGGTSYVFRRDGYMFPMGPLSFSFPGRVREFLSAAGVEAEVAFRRNQFQLVSPKLDLVFSAPLESIRKDLTRIFPEEKAGLDIFFDKLSGIIRESRDIFAWHPDYLPAAARRRPEAGDLGWGTRLDRIRKLARTPCRVLLDRHLNDPDLKNFLGSQGTSPPEMSVLSLAFMWNMMSEVGIWSPSCGIHGLSDLLAEAVRRRGGEIRLNAGVAGIRAEKGRAVGVRTESGEDLEAAFIVSNVDPKQTFLGMCAPDDLPGPFLEKISSTPYTGSEICVYLGVDPERVDWKRMGATHLFFRHGQADLRPGGADVDDFENREFEICRFSDNSPEQAPQGKAALVLRAGLPYAHFAAYRTGEKRRRPEYAARKAALAQRLIAAAENILPGLGGAIELTESATPLTYADWGRRYEGSIAGWTWSAEYRQSFERRLHVETPLSRLLLVGIYAASDLLLGGVPTALHTAGLAAGIILGEALCSRP